MADLYVSTGDKDDDNAVLCNLDSTSVSRTVSMTELSYTNVINGTGLVVVVNNLADLQCPVTMTMIMTPSFL